MNTGLGIINNPAMAGPSPLNIPVFDFTLPVHKSPLTSPLHRQTLFPTADFTFDGKKSMPATPSTYEPYLSEVKCRVLRLAKAEEAPDHIITERGTEPVIWGPLSNILMS